MSEHAVWNIHIDGAARGNPGPAAYALVIARDGAPAAEESGCLGATTNNLAEYTALVRALERAGQLGAQRLLIHSDSELLVKQMNGEYRVKNENLKPLYEQARQLARRFQQVTIRHVFRAQNSWADRLCNEALDGNPTDFTPIATSAPHAEEAKAPAEDAEKPDRAAAVREAAIACLREAASRWSRGAAEPEPAAVWDRLWDILKKHKVLRRPKPKA